MNSLLTIKEDLINFWGLEEEAEREAILDKVKKYANSTSKESLFKEIRTNFEQKEFSGLGVIYEALTENETKWGDFFKEEYQRAFKAAETAPNAAEILDTLEEISFVGDTDGSLSKELISLLTDYLDHPKDVLRYKSIYLMGDWILKENAWKYPNVTGKMTERLKDSNWRIRHIAQSELEALGSLPKGYSPSFMDKMRAKFLSPYI